MSFVTSVENPMHSRWYHFKLFLCSQQFSCLYFCFLPLSSWEMGEAKTIYIFKNLSSGWSVERNKFFSASFLSQTSKSVFTIFILML